MFIWNNITQLAQRINKVRMSENLLYVLLWSAIFAVPMLNAEMTARQSLNFDEILLAWIKITPFFFIFILHNNIIAPNNLIHTKRYKRYIVALITLLVVIFSLLSSAQSTLMPYARMMLHEYENLMTHRYIGTDGALHNPMAITDLSLGWNITFALFMTTANCGIKFIFKSVRDEQTMEQLRNQSLKVEMEYLKYQINPHFFMNTLNNIHALIDIDPESAQRTVIELSKMMRHVLYNSGNESLSLSQELEFVRNYIELMRIRYDNSVDVKLTTPQHLTNKIYIPPLLLIVFVENAFKHGVSGAEKSFIEMDVTYDSNNIHCRIENSIKEQSNEQSGGIGLINVHKRLELLYGANGFKLTNERHGAKYLVELTIPNQVYKNKK